VDSHIEVKDVTDILESIPETCEESWEHVVDAVSKVFSDPTAAVAQKRQAAWQIVGFSGIAGPFPTRAS
jgi:hypothetical protein